MAALEMSLWCSTVAGLVLGGWSIVLTQNRRSAACNRWGRRLYIANFLGIGVSVLIAAASHADGLAPLGLATGLLVVAVLSVPLPASAVPRAD